MLFGFKENEVLAVRRWLGEVEATLPVLAFTPGDENVPIGTVESALAQIEQSNPSNILQESILYASEGYPPLEVPVVLFSGLQGAEVVGLLEAWQEFTG